MKNSPNLCLLVMIKHIIKGKKENSCISFTIHHFLLVLHCSATSHVLSFRKKKMKNEVEAKSMEYWWGLGGCRREWKIIVKKKNKNGFGFGYGSDIAQWVKFRGFDCTLPPADRSVPCFFPIPNHTLGNCAAHGGPLHFGIPHL